MDKSVSVHVLLTDRGAEFSSPEPMEKRDDGTTRTRVFYCDPMQSGQKGSLENSHELLRYICPKGTDLKELGLTGQEALNEAIRNIDSYPVESFGGKCPLDVAEFMFNDLYVALSSYGIRRVEKDEVVLKPYLLKKFRCTGLSDESLEKALVASFRKKPALGERNRDLLRQAEARG